MKVFNALFYVLLVLILASGATALSIANLELGSSSQVRGQDVTGQLHIVNDANSSVTVTLASSLASSYNVRFGQTTVAIAAGASVDVPVTIYVPLSQNSGRVQLSGSITATGAANAVTTYIYLTTESMLDISKMTITVDGEDHSLKSSETYDDDLKAGTSIKLTATVRNQFSSSEEIEIRDIEMDVRSTGDLELDESDDMSDLDYGDKDTISFGTEIPSDAEDGDDYSVTFKVTGEDENGATHSDSYTARLEVKRESHEIAIKSVTVSPQTVECSGRVTITTKLENTGRYDEDKVHLLITNDELGIVQRFYEMSIDKDDGVTKTYSLTLDNKTQPGDYEFLLTSLYDSDVDSDTAVATVTVKACSQNVVNPVNPTVVNPTIPTPSVPQVVPTNGATPVYGSSSFTDSTAYVVVLVAAVVLILVILIILLVKFVF
jgi:hypothetical protein